MSYMAQTEVPRMGIVMDGKPLVSSVPMTMVPRPGDDLSVYTGEHGFVDLQVKRIEWSMVEGEPIHLVKVHCIPRSWWMRVWLGIW